MSAAGALLLLIGGLVALVVAWNAARPRISPARWYSPLWLPAMIVIELVWLFLVADLALLGVGLALGAWRSPVGRIGVGLVVTSIVLLGWIAVRTWMGMRRLRRHVSGDVHPTHWRAWFLGNPAPTPDGVREIHRIPFAEGLAADVTRPADDRVDLPVCVFVHGGAWTGGDPQRSSRDLYHALALDGWATVAIRYRFAPDASVEDQIRTVEDAIRWVRSGLARHGVRPSHVVLAGGSAGGLLAAMAALRAPRTGAGVDALVGIYGVYDMANRHRTHATWSSVERSVMKVSYADDPEAYEAVSPIDHVGPDTPPILLVHGTHDTVVPIGEATLFERVLRDAGRPVDVIPVGGAEHAYDALSGVTSRTAAAAIRTWLHRTVVSPVPTPSVERDLS